MVHTLLLSTAIYIAIEVKHHTLANIRINSIIVQKNKTVRTYTKRATTELYILYVCIVYSLLLCFCFFVYTVLAQYLHCSCVRVLVQNQWSNSKLLLLLLFAWSCYCLFLVVTGIVAQWRATHLIHKHMINTHFWAHTCFYFRKQQTGGGIASI